MGRFRILLIFSLVAISSSCFAAKPFEFTELLRCDKEHDPYGPDKLVANHSGSYLVVTGWVGLSCGEHVAKPEYREDWNAATLRVETRSDDGVVAICRCTSKFQFVLHFTVPKGRVIYLLKNGMGAAHVVAP